MGILALIETRVPQNPGIQKVSSFRIQKMPIKNCSFPFWTTPKIILIVVYIYPKISYTPMIYTPHDIISIYTDQCILIVIYTPWYPKLLRFSTTPFPGFCFKSGFQSWPGASPPGSSTQYVQNHYNYYRMGPPVDSVQLVYNRLISMVYGRYNELVHGDYHGL